MELLDMYSQANICTDTLATDDAIEQIRKYRETGDTKYRDALIHHNIRLVKSFVCRMVKPDSPMYEDCMQEGVMGLIQAIERFDLSRDNSFSTYAVYWIRQAVGRYMKNYGKSVRLPIYLLDNYYKVQNAIKSYSATHGEEPDDQEIADATGIPVGRIAELRIYPAECYSLDTPVADKEGRMEDCYGDFIPSKQNVEEDAMKSMLQTYVADAITKYLDPRAARIVSMRWGVGEFAGEPVRTLEEVAQEYGCTRERIRQIESKAFLKLRHVFTRNGMKDYLAAAGA